ncbi:MAG: SprT family zinc-dependent metalloprotease [Pseudomonadota bacterium]
MRDVELPGDPPIRVTLRRSGRAKRYGLRVSRLDGRVTLTVPSRGSERAALAFLREKELWVRDQVAQLVTAQSVEIGDRIPLEGRPARLVRTEARRGGLVGDFIEVPERVAAPGAYVAGLLKAEARERLTEASLDYAAQVGRQVSGITLKDTRSRWGSCSSAGRLMYSWRLIMAPPEVLDYVAAHEVSHLVEMNHSAAYWQVVAEICPDYARHRAWLRQEGAGLHRYRFKD